MYTRGTCFKYVFNAKSFVVANVAAIKCTTLLQMARILGDHAIKQVYHLTSDVILRDHAIKQVSK